MDAEPNELDIYLNKADLPADKRLYISVEQDIGVSGIPSPTLVITVDQYRNRSSSLTPQPISPEPVTVKNPKRMIVVTATLNVRPEPNTKKDAVGILKRGAIVQVLETADPTWGQLYQSPLAPNYVSLQYLTPV